MINEAKDREKKEREKEVGTSSAFSFITALKAPRNLKAPT